MRLYIYHRTVYLYPDLVSNSFNELRLHPLTNDLQRCESSLISVLPSTHLREYLDLNGNLVQYFEIPTNHNKLTIEARSTVRTVSRIDFDQFPYGTQMETLKDIEQRVNCRNYLQSSTYVELNPEAWKQAIDLQGNSNDVFQTAYQIMEFIYSHYEYCNSTTSVDTSSTTVIREEQGVCQDFAHAALTFCRCLGIPARYVSGYFYDHTKDQSMRGSEASHAWIEVLVNGRGWFGLDPTNNRVVDETYIILGTGRDYRDVAPITGTYFGRLPTSMEVDVSVKKVEE